MKRTAARPKKTAAKPVAPKAARVKTPPAPAAPAKSQQNQAALFEKAIALFHQRSFADARLLFEKASTGPMLEIGCAARAHARMCAQRMESPGPEPETAEDHYNLGVALLNQRRLDEAEAHFEKALHLAPEGDYIHYAMALNKGLRGDVQQAAQSLRKAIELQPRNRRQALNDPDFAELLSKQPIAALLYTQSEAGSEKN
jgi:tetratricopeptide (TPR) repeat protein